MARVPRPLVLFTLLSLCLIVSLRPERSGRAEAPGAGEAARPPLPWLGTQDPGQERRRVSAQLEELESDLEWAVRQVETLAARIARLEVERARLEADLEQVQSSTEQIRRQVQTRLQAWYRSSGLSTALLLGTVDDPTSALEVDTALARIHQHDQRLFADLRAGQERIAALRTVLEEYQWQHQQLMRALTRQNLRLDRVKEDTIRLLVAAYQIERAARRPTKQNHAPLGHEAAVLEADSEAAEQPRGMLRLPAPGAVTRTYGRKNYSPSASVLYHNGVVIAAGRDQPVKAVLAGTVVYAGAFKGYGQIMIIDHGRGLLTLTAPLGKLFKKAGDAVAAGEPVATTGTAPTLADGGVYFELRHQDHPIDPGLRPDDEQ